MQNNFKYLDEMIRSGQKEIALDSNIILGDSEESEYLEGIELDVNYIVIDGCGHTIDANGKARIFSCSAKNIEIKNTTLKNGFATDGGAINIRRGYVKITNCRFEKNAANNKGGAIFNLGELKITKSVLTENASQRYCGAILNAGEMFIYKCDFSANYAIIRAGALESTGTVKIDGCTFHENKTDGHGGAISNFGEMDVSESDISRNSAVYDAGAILVQSPVMTISKSKINENRSKDEANAIFVSGNLKIRECEVCENTSTNPGSTIYAYDADLEISNSKIIKNRCGKMISATKSELTLSKCITEGIIQSERKVNIADCILKDNDPEDEYDTTGNH